MLRMGGYRTEIRREARTFVEGRIRSALAGRANALRDIRQELAEGRSEALDLDRRVAAAAIRLDRTPITAETTVHAAHARHPDVQALFARRGLPACPHCAVGADESIAEAAFGEGFDLAALLEEMNALLGGSQ